MSRLENKNVIITGAAGGIGRLMALNFARENANLALVDINGALLEKTADELSVYNITIRTYRCDISQKKDIEKTAGAIIKDFGHVDVLVNNAGIVFGKTIAESSYEEMKKTIDVNLLGCMWMTRQFLPGMMKRNSGHVANVASAMGFIGVPRMADYVATKFALVGFTETLRMEMKKYGYHGIRTTCICPSGIDTGMFRGYKPPLFSPLLKPEYVARKTVRAVKRNRAFLKLPFIVKFIPFTKGLPAPFVDFSARAMGLFRCMDYFEGH